MQIALRASTVCGIVSSAMGEHLLHQYAYPSTPENLEHEADAFLRLKASKPALYDAELARLAAYADRRQEPPAGSLYDTWMPDDFRHLIRLVLSRQ
jgi:hypothetical protein